MTYEEDINEFDLLLDEDEDVAVAPSRPSRGAAPAATAAAPRRFGRAPVDAPRTSAGGTVRVAPDWNRIAAVLFVVVIGMLVLWFAVSSIRDARRNGAYKDYFSKVRELSTQSTQQGSELDTILTDQNSGDRSQRVARIELLSTRAAKLAKDAEALDPPKQLEDSQQWFVTSLDYRARGLASLQRSLTDTMKTTNKSKAADNVAQAMSRLVASDVVWSDSFAAGSRDVLRRDDVNDVTVPDSVFIKDLDAASPTAIAQTLERIRIATTATKGGTPVVPKDGKIRGGQLEGGRVTVSPSGQAISLDSLTEIPSAENMAFEIPFTNQGEVQLTDVPVKITLRGENSDPIELTGAIDSVDPGQTASVKIPLTDLPTFGEVLTMDVLVGPILGEAKTDNNTATFKVQFSL